MKRGYILATAALTAAIPFQSENEKVECNETSCVSEPVAVMPEQHHSNEEKPEAVAEVQYVEIPSSPNVSVEKGSQYHLEWEARTGEKAYDITDPEALKWIRERVAENKNSLKIPKERRTATNSPVPAGKVRQ